MPENWISFWNTQHSIYVNARHLDLHYRDVADRLLQLHPKPSDTVLDFGCGEATHANRVAASVNCGSAKPPSACVTICAHASANMRT